MDKEQAIEKLNDIRCHVKETSAEEQALVMAIDALKQPVATDTNVGDTISRQATIDAVNNAFDRETLLTGFVRSIALRAIRDMPSVQPEPHWIPVSERLPEKTPLWKTVGYLATVTCDSWEEPRTMYVKWETTTVRGKEVSRWTFDNRLFPSEWRVVAWMPMPEAYKEGGEKI